MSRESPDPPSLAVGTAIDAVLRAVHATDLRSDSLATSGGLLVEHGRRLLGGADCVLAAVHPERPGHFQVVAGAGPWAAAQIGSEYPMEGTLNGRALLTGGVVTSADVPSETRLAEVARAGGITAGLVVPLPTGLPFPDGRTGLGVIGWWRQDPSGFSPAEIAGAERFTELAGAALSRAELLRAYRASTDRLHAMVRDLDVTVSTLDATTARLNDAHRRALEALVAVSRLVDSDECRDPDSFLGEMTATVAGLVCAERVAFTELTPEGTLRPLGRAHGIDQARLATLAEFHVHPDGDRPAEVALFQGRVVRLRVPGDAQSRPARGVGGLAQRDLMLATWQAGTRPLGLLTAIDSTSPEGFGEEDAWVLEICARATALVWGQVSARERAISSEARRLSELREQSLRLTSIIGTAQDAILSMDADGRLADVNAAAERLFGVSRDEVLGRRLADVVIPPEFREAHAAGVRRSVDSGDEAVQFRRFEVEALRSDGTRFPAEVAVVRTTSDGRPLFTGFVRDLSEHRRAAEREREQAGRIAALEQAKSQLLNLASHELRGPIGLLNGYLTMLQDGQLGELPPRVAEILPMLRNKVTEMNLLVDGMLDAARLEDDHLRLSLTTLDLRAVVGRTVGDVTGEARDRERTSVELPPTPVTVVGDAIRLGQVVGNLVQNALKYSPGGGAVEVRLATDERIAQLEVEDHGIGIAPRDMERLFTRFGRIVNSQNSHIPGTGLGLYLAREMARLHGGDITASSMPNSGSTFVLTLPLAEPAS